MISYQQQHHNHNKRQHRIIGAIVAIPTLALAILLIYIQTPLIP